MVVTLSLVKKLPLDTFSMEQRIYVLDTIQGTMIKRIHKSTQEGCLFVKVIMINTIHLRLSMNRHTRPGNGC
jgi:hypothetical protein